MEKLSKDQGTVKTGSPDSTEFQQLEESVNATFSVQPKNELEAVNLQMAQLSKIKVVADKLKELRQQRDEEKKKFDEEVKTLNSMRQEINEQKELLIQMYT
jgi:hypothetical protein